VWSNPLTAFGPKTFKITSDDPKINTLSELFSVQHIAHPRVSDRDRTGDLQGHNLAL
jgi:hypothetical protein